ncbi:hypothetical protein [Methylovorus glucosotrophus]|uniref:Type I restriction enzyme R protein N-terminal domain-containing protein n=1 Tax=Methylovorus glucosotrophus (strain SIP3-4) TaxID=582744 RepID=C6XAE7_METGS|nr:hypothetical protein [Methylovorus glucosotrophus]ACT51688.1 conserved hypothetical protein [Methylovorus glucosotrophus SIP3-4]
MEKQQVNEILEYAIQQLMRNDAELLEVDVSERAVMFHLGRYIREKTPVEFDVDCEYNRHLTDIKKLTYLKRQLEIENIHEVFPDILIHRRNTDAQNIAVIEIKKHGQCLASDFRKLSAFKEEPYLYTFAIQVVIGVPNSSITFAFV